MFELPVITYPTLSLLDKIRLTVSFLSPIPKEQSLDIDCVIVGEDVIEGTGVIVGDGVIEGVGGGIVWVRVRVGLLEGSRVFVLRILCVRVKVEVT
jgi:hypothetical protein